MKYDSTHTKASSSFPFLHLDGRAANIKISEYWNVKIFKHVAWEQRVCCRQSMKYIRYLSNWTTTIVIGTVCSSLVGTTWIMYWRAVLLSVNCFSPVGLGNYSEPGSNTFKQFISCQWPPEIVSTVDPLLNLPTSGQACVLHPLIAHWTLWENPFLKSARKVIKDLLRVSSVQLFEVP